MPVWSPPLSAAFSGRKGGEAPPIPQSFHRTVLPNGMRVVTEEMPGTRSVALGVWVGTGSRAEAEGLGGTAHFIEHLLFKGTPTRSAAALAREIDSMGGHLDAFTGREYTCFYLNILVEHIERGMNILADILLNSTFPPEEIDRERQVVLEEIRMSEDNPEDTVYETLVQNVWPRSSLGRPILGKAEEISTVSRPKLLGFLRSHYCSSNFVMGAAGGVGHEELVRLWKRYFPLPKKKAQADAGGKPKLRPGFYHKSRDLEQTHLCYGTGGLRQKDRGRYALHILNTILGGSMSSRLFQEIREKRGLAYSVYSAHSSYRDTGLFSVCVGTSPRHAPRVMRLVEGQLARLRRSKPTAKEVVRAKDHLKGSLILSLESSGGRMMSLAKQELYYGRLFSVDDTLREIDMVTPGDVHDLAVRLFEPGKSAWAAVGPEESISRVSKVKR